MFRKQNLAAISHPQSPDRLLESYTADGNGKPLLVISPMTTLGFMQVGSRHSEWIINDSVLYMPPSIKQINLAYHDKKET
jgi:hypothetical protein